MANSICRWQCPEDWAEWSQWLAAGLHARNRWRLPVLLVGLLFAHGRRTVTTWLRAAGVSDDFPLARLYSWHRAMRIFDGPDEVHMRTVARAELGREKSALAAAVT